MEHEWSCWEFRPPISSEHGFRCGQCPHFGLVLVVFITPIHLVFQVQGSEDPVQQGNFSKSTCQKANHLFPSHSYPLMVLTILNSQKDHMPPSSLESNQRTRNSLPYTLRTCSVSSFTVVRPLRFSVVVPCFVVAPSWKIFQDLAASSGICLETTKRADEDGEEKKDRFGTHNVHCLVG